MLKQDTPDTQIPSFSPTADYTGPKYMFVSYKKNNTLAGNTEIL
jgi:hypothetical protein